MGKVSCLVHDSTDLNADNFSIDRELFHKQIKEETEDRDEFQEDTQLEEPYGYPSMEPQTWRVNVKCEENIDDESTPQDAKHYTCNVCGRTFKRKDRLLLDLMSHGLVEFFQCHYCDRQFARKDVLKKHLAGSHGFAQEVTCPTCRVKCRDLLLHVRHSHHSDPFSCDVCHKTFKRLDSVRRHKLIHSGQRHFWCHLCERRFSQTSTLKRHLLSHTKETPFSCGLCTKRYTRKYILARHVLRRHQTVTPHVCHPCGKSFHTEGFLRKHVRQMHGGR